MEGNHKRDIPSLVKDMREKCHWAIEDFHQLFSLCSSREPNPKEENILFLHFDLLHSLAAGQSIGGSLYKGYWLEHIAVFGGSLTSLRDLEHYFESTLRKITALKRVADICQKHGDIPLGSMLALWENRLKEDFDPVTLKRNIGFLLKYSGRPLREAMAALVKDTEARATDSTASHPPICTVVRGMLAASFLLPLVQREIHFLLPDQIDKERVLLCLEKPCFPRFQERKELSRHCGEE